MDSPRPAQGTPPQARHDTGGPPDTLGGGHAPTNAPALSFLAPPQAPDELGRLGPYRILGELGHGGMGMVLRAEDPQLKRQIALKVMLPQHAANPLAKKRFLREAEAQAAVEHDHVIPIFQVGEDRGTPFIAMPLLKGQTLAAALKASGALPVAEVVRIGREMAEGLTAAHERGLIHRDIKPGNVWLEGDRRRVRILDFGLARAEATQQADGDEPITASGTIVGTPSYMSPEQARAEAVDHRTDLFSLGVVLYQLATGRLPFNGGTTMAVLTALAVDTPQPPRLFAPGLPPGLDDLILRLLAKKPAARPQLAGAVAEELRQIELAMTATIQAIPLGALPESVPEVWSHITEEEPDEVVHRPKPVQPLAASRRDAKPQAAKRGSVPVWVWAVAAVVGFLVVVGGAVVVFQQVTKITTPKGTLVIESSDPDVEVVVKKDGAVIVDRTKKREIELKVGEGYTIELAEKKDGLRLNTDKFAITKDGKSTVRVYVDKLAAAKPKEAPKPKEPPVVGDDPARRAAADADFPALEAKSKAAGVTFASFAKDVNDFKVRHGGTPAAVRAAELLTKLPSPLDALDPAKIPEDATAVWKAAGFDGKDVVAVLGEHRARQSGPARRVSFSSDGKLLLSGGEGGVWFWEVTERGLNCRSHDAAALVVSVAVRPDGKMAAAGLQDGILYLWRVDAGAARRLDPVKVDPGALWSVAFSPDGKTLATGGSDGVIRLWRVTDQGAQKGDEVAAHSDWVFDLAFTPDGKRLASASRDKTAALWDLSKPKPEELARLREFGGEVFSVAISGDGMMLAAGSGDKTVRVWDLTGDLKKAKAVLTGQGDLVYAVAVSADGRRVVSGGANGSLCTWELDQAADRPRVVTPNTGHSLRGLALGRNASVLASASENGSIRLWDLQSGKEVQPPTGPVGATHDVAFSPDASAIATAGADGVLRLWDPLRGQAKTVWATETGQLLAVCFSPDGTRLATGGDDRDLKVRIGTVGGKVEYTIPSVGVPGMAFSPDGRSVVAGSTHNPHLRLVDARTGASELLDTSSMTLGINDVAFSPDGRKFATANGDNSGRVWDLGARKIVRVLPGHEHWVVAVAYSPDGRTVATTGNDKFVWLWDLTRDAVPVKLPTGEYTDGLAYSPDGRLLASLTRGGTVTVWDVAALSKRWECKLPGPARRVRFAADGRHLAAANTNGTVYILRLPKFPMTESGPAVLAFDGKTTLVRLPFSPTNANAYTVEAWVKFDAPTSEGDAGIASAFTPNRGVSLFRSPDGAIRLGERVGRGQDVSSERKHAGHTGWVHVAAVWDGQASRLYVNGVRQPHERREDLPQAQIDALSQPWMLGASQPVPGEPERSFFAGQMREVRFTQGVRYDKDFTPAARHEPDMRTYALYRCDDGQGDKLKDSSGNNLHGKIVGAKWVKADAFVPTPEQANAAKALGVRPQTENSIGMRLNLIPAGKFLMGSPDSEAGRRPNEGPQHEVTITRPFYFGAHEVTVGQFKSFVTETGYKTEAERNGAGAVRVGGEFTPGTTWQTPGFAQTDAHPVTCVSWNDAVAFCEWLSKKEGKTYRLPTEAEWEYACRAGSQMPYYFGVEARQLTEHGWVGENSQGATHPVGQLKANAWGLFDLYGNVWESCSDWHSETYYAESPKADPKGPVIGTLRAKRGSGWPHPVDSNRSAFRHPTTQDYRSWAGGFRVVGEVRPTVPSDGPKR